VDTNELQGQTRGADDTEASSQVDELIFGATRQSRRFIAGRALAALIIGVVVISAAGLAGTMSLQHGNAPAPARPTPSSTALGGSPSPAFSTASDAMTRKQLQIVALVKAKLPRTLQVTADHGIGQRSVADMAILDSQGYTWIDARVGTLGEVGWDPCRGVYSCSVERVRGGTLYTLQEVETEGNSTHYSASYTFERPDGRYVYVNQSNVFDGAGRRLTMPLTDRQVRDIVTASQWDALVADCRPEPGPNC
jgi:hypothetical protein